MASTDDKGPTLTAVNIAFLCITIFSVLLRVFTRLRVVKSFGIDDTLILFAAAASIAQVVSPQIAIKYGLGRHIDEQLPEWRKPYAESMVTASMAYNLAAMFIKLSLLAFYLRLSPYSTFRFLTYILIFISAAFGVGSVVAVGVQCIPLSMLWDPTAPGGKCFNVTLFYFANAGIHIVTEILIYILPIQTLWKLHLPMRQKLGLCGLMGLGAMLIVISCYRIVTIRELLGSADVTWNVVTPLIWYCIEGNLAIFIACGPAFLAFFRHYFPSVFGGSSSPTRDKISHPRGSYPLGSVAHTSPRGCDRNGTRTLVTATKGVESPYYGEDNSSEEMIILSNSGIQKQIDVWVENEDADGRKSDSRSRNSEGGEKVANAV